MAWTDNASVLICRNRGSAGTAFPHRDRPRSSSQLFEKNLRLRTQDPLTTRQATLTSRQVRYLAVRRVLDVIVSILLLLCAAPLIAVVALAIVVDSPGGPFFRQHRIGKDGKPFTIYKFRSMFTDAPAYSFKRSSRDTVVTRVGRLLRISAIDELPQLLNVIKGEMALIGPRPEMKFIVDSYQPWQAQRHSIRPGVTGWWQVHHRNESPLHLGIGYDLYYMEHVGPRIDVKIAALTARVVVVGAFRFISRRSELPVTDRQETSASVEAAGIRPEPSE
jgi:lipopolysaccharide/colanic/teichoic acid biosynthesis glycosyltransferase